MLQRVADCSLLQCVVSCCSVLCFVGVLQCAAVCCSVLQCVDFEVLLLRTANDSYTATHINQFVVRVALCCSVLRCVAVCCSVCYSEGVALRVLQRACCSVLQRCRR